MTASTAIRDVGRIYLIDGYDGNESWFWAASFQLTGRKSYDGPLRSRKRRRRSGPSMRRGRELILRARRSPSGWAVHSNAGSSRCAMRILAFFNKNEPARDKFENGYGKIRQLYELLEPDDFLMPRPVKRDHHISSAERPGWLALAVLLAVQQSYSAKYGKITEIITLPALAAYECR
jgi:hypothetical protein